jgi:hypothetical protein
LPNFFSFFPHDKRRGCPIFMNNYRNYHSLYVHMLHLSLLITSKKHIEHSNGRVFNNHNYPTSLAKLRKDTS